MRGKRMKTKPRKVTMDNSRNLSIRMTEEDYQRLKRYLDLTRLGSTAYFRHLILEEHIKGRSRELNHALHASLNKIYSNVHQVIRHQRARDLSAEAVAKMNYLIDRLCEEVCLLASQK